MRVGVRPGAWRDIAELERLVQTSGDHPWFVKLRFREKSRGIGEPLVAILDHRIVGFAHLRYGLAFEPLIGDIPVLHHLVVDPDFRGMGVGSALVRQAEQCVVRSDAESSALVVGVDEEDLAAIEFYKKFDFEGFGSGPLATFDIDASGREIFPSYFYALWTDLGHLHTADKKPIRRRSIRDALAKTSREESANEFSFATKIPNVNVRSITNSLWDTERYHHSGGLVTPYSSKAEGWSQKWIDNYQHATALAVKAWEGRRHLLPDRLAHLLNDEDLSPVVNAGALLRMGSVTETHVVSLLPQSHNLDYQNIPVQPGVLNVVCSTNSDSLNITNHKNKKQILLMHQFAAALHGYYPKIPSKIYINGVNNVPLGFSYLKDLKDLIGAEVLYKNSAIPEVINVRSPRPDITDTSGRKSSVINRSLHYGIGEDQSPWLSQDSGDYYPERKIDAVVVPTRGDKSLKMAIETASRLHCSLRVYVNPGPIDSQVLKELVDHSPSAGLQVYEIKDDNLAGLFRPKVNTNELVNKRSVGGLANARNTALLHAYMAQEERILMLDDDCEVAPNTYERIFSWSGAMENTCDVIGLGVGGYPDRSVLGHLYNQLDFLKTGITAEEWNLRPEEIKNSLDRHVAKYMSSRKAISGGAMLINPRTLHSHSPDIYDEDWFMVHDSLRSNRARFVANAVIQADYNPFNAGRATKEVVGELLEFGIFNAMRENLRIPQDLSENYWNTQISALKNYQERLFSEFREFISHPNYTSHWSQSGLVSEKDFEAVVDAIRGQTKSITGKNLSSLAKQWRSDDLNFQQMMSNLKHMSLNRAASHLGIGEIHTVSKKSPTLRSSSYLYGANSPREEAIIITLKLIDIDTRVSEAAAVDYCDSLLRQAGLKTEIVVPSNELEHPNLIVRIPGTDGGKAHYVHGHLDTPRHGTWFPEQGRITRDRAGQQYVRGLGASSAAELACFIAAIREFKRQGLAPERDIILGIHAQMSTLTANNRNRNGAQYLANHRTELFEGVSDISALSPGGFGVNIGGKNFYFLTSGGEKGLSHAIVSIAGTMRSSGIVDPSSPIAIATALASAIEERTVKNAWGGEIPELMRPTLEEVAEVAGLSNPENSTKFFDDLERLHPTLGATLRASCQHVIQPTGIQTAPDGNILGNAKLWVDIRGLPAQEEQAEDALRRFVLRLSQENGWGVRFELRGSFDGHLNSQPNSRAFRIMKAFLEDRDPTVEVRQIISPYESGNTFLRSYGNSHDSLFPFICPPGYDLTRLSNDAVPVEAIHLGVDMMMHVIGGPEFADTPRKRTRPKPSADLDPKAYRRRTSRRPKRPQSKPDS